VTLRTVSESSTTMIVAVRRRLGLGRFVDDRGTRLDFLQCELHRVQDEHDFARAEHRRAVIPAMRCNCGPIAFTTISWLLPTIVVTCRAMELVPLRR